MPLSFLSRPKIEQSGGAAEAQNANALWANLFKADLRRDPEEAECVEVLKKVPLFEGISNRELSVITRLLHKRTYQAEEFVFHQNDPGLGMYVILHGTVAIMAETNRPPLAELHDGDFFGELALLDELPRSAGAKATAPSVILGFFQPDFFSLVDRHPRLGNKILLRLARMIGRRLRVTVDQTRALQRELGPPFEE